MARESAKKLDQTIHINFNAYNFALSQSGARTFMPYCGAENYGVCKKLQLLLECLYINV